jgi:hypothetical protein
MYIDSVDGKKIINLKYRLKNAPIREDLGKNALQYIS